MDGWMDGWMDGCGVNVGSGVITFFSTQVEVTKMSHCTPLKSFVVFFKLIGAFLGCHE